MPVGRWERTRKLLAAPLSRMPWQTAYWYHAKIACAVEQARTGGKFDLAHVQLARMALAGAALRAFGLNGNGGAAYHDGSPARTTLAQ